MPLRRVPLTVALLAAFVGTAQAQTQTFDLTPPNGTPTDPGPVGAGTRAFLVQFVSPTPVQAVALTEVNDLKGGALSARIWDADSGEAVAKGKEVSAPANGAYRSDLEVPFAPQAGKKYLVGFFFAKPDDAAMVLLADSNFDPPYTAAAGSVANVTVSGSLASTGPDDAAPSQDDKKSLRGLSVLTGQGPRITAARSLDFGTNPIGSTVPKTLKIENTGDAELTVKAGELTGDSAADYSFAPSVTFPVMVPARTGATPGSAEIVLQLKPGNHGVRNAQLALVSDAFGAPSYTIALTARGEGPKIVVQPASIDFGPSNVNVAAPTQRLYIKNEGETELVVSAIALSGAAASDFTCASCAGSPVVKVQPGQTQNVTLTFKPSVAGQRSAEAAIQSNDTLNAGEKAPRVPLVGTGTSPVIQAQPAALEFGEVRLGSALVKQITLSNTGTGPLTVNSVFVGGRDASQFEKQSIQVPFVIAAGNNTVINIAFRPSVLKGAGVFQGILSVASDDPARTQLMVNLTGTGVSAQLTVNPVDEVNFGSHMVGRASASRPVELVNNGTAPLRVTNITLSGLQATAFAVSAPTLPFVLQPKAKETLQVTVRPSFVGLHNAALIVGTDAGIEVQARVGLRALGINSVFSISPSEIDFGLFHSREGSPAKSEPKTVTLVNQSSDPVQLQKPALEGDSPSSFSFTDIPETIPAGGQVTTQVTFTSQRVSAAKAALVLKAVDAIIPKAQVQLYAYATGTYFEAQPPEADLGPVAIGGQSGNLRITLTNIADRDVRLAQVVSAAQGRFPIDMRGLQLGVVPKGGTVSFGVSFKPDAEGEATSFIRVKVGDGSNLEEDLEIPVRGIGKTGVGADAGCSAAGGGIAGPLALLAIGLASMLRRRGARAS